MSNLTYRAEQTAVEFHEAFKVPIRGIMGPPGSGKSVTMVMELLAVSARQEPAPDGVRYTRHAVIRSTYSELEGTTRKTIEQWLPPEFGKIVTGKVMTGKWVIPLPDGTTINMELTFLSIMNDDDLSKLDSSEFTYVWLNEANGLPEKLLGKALERSGRYPPSAKWNDGGYHITDSGVILDYNPPSRTHWLIKYFEGGNPNERNRRLEQENSLLLKQPPALLEFEDDQTGAITYKLNPKAENLRNLDNGKKYLRDLDTYLRTGQIQMIQTRLLCRYGSIQDGKPIHPSFDYDRHVSKESLRPAAQTNVMMSTDTSGVHPCSLFWQFINGQWRIIHGLYGESMGLEEFIQVGVLPLLATEFPNCNVINICDPANARDGRTATTPVDLFIEYGIPSEPATTNAFDQRVIAGETLLLVHGNGSVVINKDVADLVTALDGEYKYRKSNISGVGSQYVAKTLKNGSSHWGDAYQYGALHIQSTSGDHKLQDRAKALTAKNYRRYRRM